MSLHHSCSCVYSDHQGLVSSILATEQQPVTSRDALVAVDVRKHWAWEPVLCRDLWRARQVFTALT